jgi:hypothetical protein
MTNWLSDWDYRKSHLMLATYEGSTNFPVCIKVYYGAGTDGTEKVDHLTDYNGTVDTWAGKIYCSSHCKTDFGDIRFTDNDGDTELNYWMQEKVDSNYAIFWVKVTDDVSANTTIYIYYGKASAVTTSDGNGVFTLFDDFEDDVLDSDKWVSGGSISEAGGLLTLESGGYIQSKLSWYQNIIIFMKAKFSIPSGFIGLCKTTGGTDDAAKFIGDTTIWARNQQSTYYEKTSVGAFSGDFYKFAIKWLSKYPVTHSAFNSLQYFIDGTGKAWLANSVPNEAIPATENSTGVGQIIFEWIAVRKVASAGEEPEHSTWGIAEHSGVTCNIANVTRNLNFERVLNLKISQTVDVATRPVPTREDGEVVDTGTYLIHPLQVTFDSRLTDAEKTVIQAMLDDHLTITLYLGNWTFSDGWFVSKGVVWEYVSDDELNIRPWKCSFNLIFESVAYVP